jgi:hypothetical protein
MGIEKEDDNKKEERREKKKKWAKDKIHKPIDKLKERKIQ